MTLFLLAVFLLVVSSRLAPLRVSRSEKSIKDQYIVVFNNDITPGVYQKQIDIAKLGLKVAHTYEHAIKGFSAKMTPSQLLQLRANPHVQYIEGDEEVSVADCSVQFAESWGLTRISQQKIDLDGDYAADSKEGAGVIAYVLDTGVRVTHNEFKSGRATFGFKADPSYSDTDGNGHGTHVASTIAGKLYGVAKSAQIVAVKVLGDSGSGSWAGVIAGIDYTIAQHKAKGKPSVANLSIGGGFIRAVNDAVNAAVAAGITMVVAAGNNNGNACNYSPASAVDAVTVGATNIASKGDASVDVRSSFSNYGNCVDIFAPGSDITGAWMSSDIATNTISGTSMASPHVCGAAALILGAQPNLTPLQVKQTLTGNANPGMIDLICRSNAVCEESPNKLAYNGCNN